MVIEVILVKKDKNGLTEEQFLKNYDISDFEKPSVTVDNLLFSIDEIENEDIRKLNDKRLQILLVYRDNHPFIDKWCLPGGFVKMDESLEEASLRTLEIKTSVKDIYLEQLYTFGGVKRDPRTRIFAVAYMGLVDKKKTSIIDKRKNTDWFTVKQIEGELILENDHGTIVKTSNLAFDHNQIIEYGISRMKNKLEYTDIAFSLLPDEFTMAELQQVYEVVLDKKLTKANFQRKIKEKVECLNTYKTGGFRPALLYKYKDSEFKTL